MIQAPPSSSGSAAPTRPLVAADAFTPAVGAPRAYESASAGSGTAKLQVGRRIGPYRLCVRIGGGGMATVFLASRTLRGGERDYVALKCMHPALAVEPEFPQMLADEARVLARLQHPNVCPLLDWGVHEGIYFLAIPFLEGQTMRSIRARLSARGAPRDPTWHACTVAKMIADAAEGLHAAHELRDASGELLDVVHRDVSPENLFVTYSGSVLVLDFGLVRVRGQKHQRTRTGIVKGKFAYLQPEVIRGETPDRRADVWSLGVVMWEMLTRRRLFRQADDAATLKAVSAQPIQPPSRLCSGLPPSIDEVVLRALERDPARRFADAREMGRALVRFTGQQRRAVGSADLADMLQLLFPGGVDCARQCLTIAEQIDTSQADPEGHPLPPLSARPVAGGSGRHRSGGGRRRGRLEVALGSITVVLVLLAGVSAFGAALGDRETDQPRLHPGPARPAASSPVVAPEPDAARALPLAAFPLPDTSLAIEVTEIPPVDGQGIMLRMDVVSTEAPATPSRAP